jgi:hypothetical protein
MTTGAAYRRSRRLAKWLFANGARIQQARAEGDEDTAARLTALQRQREPIYDAAYMRWWDGWSALQDTATTHGGGLEPPPGTDPVVGCPLPQNVAESVAAFWMGVEAERASRGEPVEDSMYCRLTGEPVSIGIERACEVMRAKQAVGNSS